MQTIKPGQVKLTYLLAAVAKHFGTINLPKEFKIGVDSDKLHIRQGKDGRTVITYND